MNALLRALVEKAGYANGFENVVESSPRQVILSSARHRSRVLIQSSDDTPNGWTLSFPCGPSYAELNRSLSELVRPDGAFQASGEMALSRILRRAAELAMSLPTHAADRFAQECANFDREPPTNTEALRLAKQRIGQDLFRQALLEYWGGACAVTGIAVPEILRASHAKPWAECSSDAERLNVFNGFLLCANLDALFDRGLMSFSTDGTAIFSHRIDEADKQRLGLAGRLQLQWIADEHQPFLEWHRSNVFETK